MFSLTFFICNLVTGERFNALTQILSKQNSNLLPCQTTNGIWVTRTGTVETVCPITLIYCCACFRINDRFILNAFKCCWGICKQRGHCMVSPLMLFSYQYKSSFFQTRLHMSAFFQNSEFENSAEHCCIDNSVTTNFFFFPSLYILFLLSHPTLLLLCRKNMKYLSGHRALKAQFSTW